MSGVAGWKKSVLEAEANLASSLLGFALLCLSWHVGLLLTVFRAVSRSPLRHAGCWLGI